MLVLLQAKRRPLSFERQLYNNQLLWSPSPLLENDVDLETTENHGPQAASDKLMCSCEPISRFLDNSSPHGENQDIGSSDQYLVPSSLIDRWGSAMGIQTFYV